LAAAPRAVLWPAFRSWRRRIGTRLWTLPPMRRACLLGQVAPARRCGVVVPSQRGSGAPVAGASGGAAPRASACRRLLLLAARVWPDLGLWAHIWAWQGLAS
jgi:hypothetical protein